VVNRVLGTPIAVLGWAVLINPDNAGHSALLKNVEEARNFEYRF
jgi:hypothetical protein